MVSMGVAGWRCAGVRGRAARWGGARRLVVLAAAASARVGGGFGDGGVLLRFGGQRGLRAGDDQTSSRRARLAAGLMVMAV